MQTSFDFAAKHSPQNRVCIWGVTTTPTGVDNLVRQMWHKTFNECLRRADSRLLSEVVLVSNGPKPFENWFHADVNIGGSLTGFGSIARLKRKMSDSEWSRAQDEQIAYHHMISAARDCIWLERLRNELLHGMGIVVHPGRSENPTRPGNPNKRFGMWFENEADAVSAVLLQDQWRGSRDLNQF